MSTSNVFLNGQILLWNQELNYLGIVLCSAKKFTVNQQKCKQKFFKSINGIFGKVGLNSSLPVLSSLIETCCLPSLLYASECLTWNASMLRGCKNAYAHVFFILFHTYDMSTIAYCQYYMGVMPVELKVASRKLKFLSNLKSVDNSILRTLLMKDSELHDLKIKYDIVNNSCKWNDALKKYFENKLML